VNDRSGNLLANDSNLEKFSERQQRFLDAYRGTFYAIAPAARLARVARCAVYRWMAADPAFVVAMKQVTEEGYREHKAKVQAQVDARRHWRHEREQSPERKTMRRANLARAREAKQRKREG
jgi:hypothetical protein